MKTNQERLGYTLMEMMMVMAILVIAASISVPVIHSMLADGRLSAAADQVRAQLAETRARAMDEGRPWRLAYLPNTGVYQLAPEESTDWEQKSDEPMETAELVRGVLPKDIVFGAKEEDISGRQEAGQAGSDWETLAIYLPGGDARDDTMTYFGHVGFLPMRVQVRALTGAMSVEQAKPSNEGGP